jgi:hypothetical protein
MKLSVTEGKKIMQKNKMQIKKDLMSFRPKKTKILKNLRRD